MSNCAVCSTSLKFSNTPILGLGKLSTGETMCTSCCRLLTKASPALRPAKLTLAEAQNVINPAQEKLNDIISTTNKAGGLQFSPSTSQGKKALTELPGIIGSNETILSMVEGQFNKGYGLLVATNMRLLFVESGLMYGLKVEDFALRTITSIQCNSGLLFADIVVMANGNAEKISNVIKLAAKPFCDVVRDKLNEISQPVAAAATTIVNQQVDVADQLKKLAALKDDGILTQEEFDGQKKKLLGL